MSLKYLHPYLYEIVHDIVKQRIKDKRFPYVATRNEVNAKISSDVTAAIEEMKQEGLISCSENVNGIGLYRTLKDKDDENDNVQ